MAHGFSGTRNDGLPDYAKAFCAAGFAVILFDYRHFGASTGEPRQLLDIDRQIDDYRAAVTYARQLDGVDPARIVVWGTSFSGGHVFVLGATDPNIAAVIAQAPFTEGIPTLAFMPLTNVLRATYSGLRDQVGAWLGRSPHLIPAVGVRHLCRDDSTGGQARFRRDSAARVPCGAMKLALGWHSGLPFIGQRQSTCTQDALLVCV
jgi:pimeloyl-ACP methyl ester carboxylesterase